MIWNVVLDGLVEGRRCLLDHCCQFSLSEIVCFISHFIKFRFDILVRRSKLRRIFGLLSVFVGVAVYYRPELLVLLPDAVWLHLFLQPWQSSVVSLFAYLTIMDLVNHVDHSSKTPRRNPCLFAETIWFVALKSLFMEKCAKSIQEFKMEALVCLRVRNPKSTFPAVVSVEICLCLRQFGLSCVV